MRNQRTQNRSGLGTTAACPCRLRIVAAGAGQYRAADIQISTERGLAPLFLPPLQEGEYEQMGGRGPHPWRLISSPTPKFFESRMPAVCPGGPMPRYYRAPAARVKPKIRAAGYGTVRVVVSSETTMGSFYFSPSFCFCELLHILTSSRLCLAIASCHCSSSDSR